MERKFTMIDEEFDCMVCNQIVKKLNYTARDHCPFCLSSIHVDINPGDRNCDCKGILKPIGLEKHKNNYKIIFKCEICGIVKKNIAALDDNMELMIKLSSNAV